MKQSRYELIHITNILNNRNKLRNKLHILYLYLSIKENPSIFISNYKD